MLLNSPVYLFLFFPVIYILFRIVRAPGGQRALLCAASLVFAAFSGWRDVLLLLLSAAVNYLLARLAVPGSAEQGSARHEKASAPRLWLCALGIALDLCLLCFYKYARFLLGWVPGLPELLPAAASLPLGISFFTFLEISYLADIKREKISPCRNFGDFLLYVSFFPRLAAGPLVRYGQHTAALTSPAPGAEETAAGLRRFVRGLAKKVLLADVLGAAADAVFAADSLGSAAAWFGAVCYTLQLFYDFSGYSDMALGMGAVFGLPLPENFDHPYVSLSLTEFWRRWHITLGAWFRDYVYIPLGGNRRGKGRTAVNKLIVFALTGLWHGAGWTFVLWGLWHGVLMMLESGLKERIARWSQSAGGRLGLRAYTLLAVLLGFVLFRASSLGEAGRVLGAMFAFRGGWGAAALRRTLLTGVNLAALAAGILFSAPVRSALDKRLPEGPAGEALRDAGSLVLLLLSACVLAGGGFKPLIYAAF